MRLKPGVKLGGVGPETVVGMLVTDSVYQSIQFNSELIVTSARDGKHMPHSKHAIGQAFDARIYTVPEDRWSELRKALQEALQDEFDVVLEKNHMHIEWDPKD